ncbi:RICIN domain-containing protein [Amycolatopsis sp. NBC_01488]|uniref:RICIN domain-containing protein n=1 Tax=Amycolatopsis sp. NBC_01488 TaxID=2903563 RepID=UPI002E2C32B6|nr:RICIN domain-containing protein [Amycolatopsis sp. NBC_01488]
MTKMKRLMVTVAAAAGLFGLVAVPQAGAAPADGKGTAVTSIGDLKLRPSKVAGAAKQRATAKAAAQAVDPGPYLLESAAFGRCWDADLGTINANGTKMQLWDCNDTAPNQAFWLTQNPEGYYRFQNYQSGRYLDADTNTIGANGTKVQLWDYMAGGKNQWWTLTSIPEGYLRLQTPASPRYLTAEGSVGANGTRLQLWDFIAGGKSQWWF